VSLSSLKITSRTFFKIKIQNKIWCAQFGKIKGMTWQKDAFLDDAWRCRVSQTQWRWMAKCSRHAAQRRRTRGHQSSCDTKMMWQGQTSSKIAASFLNPRQPHDVACSPDTAEPYNAGIERRAQRVWTIRAPRDCGSASNGEIATTTKCVLPPTQVDLFRSLRRWSEPCRHAELMLFVLDSIHVSLHNDREQYRTTTQLLLQTCVN